MSESSSYSSLLDLVDSHLSKVNIQSIHLDNGQTTADKTIPLNNMPPDTGSCFGTSKRLPIPTFNLSGNQHNVLAEQVTNMLKAKLANEKQQKVSDEIKKEPQIKDTHLSETDCNDINLTEALSLPFKFAVKSDSKHSSIESLFEPEFVFDDESDYEDLELPMVSLSCHTDLSYILDFKLPRTKCSTFGKILVSRFRPFLSPYERKMSLSSVKKFDFKSKSPCDILKEKTMHKCL